MREDTIPEQIFFRDTQLNDLKMRVFGPPIWDSPGSHMFLQGRPGTGKTLCVKKMEGVLTNTLCEEKITHTKLIYISCGRTKTDTSTLYHLCKEVGINKKGLSFDDYIGLFYRTIDENYKYVIIILDEVDKIMPKDPNKDNLFYCLVRGRDMRELKNSYISLICVSNDARAKYKLSEGTQSSFGVNWLHFPKYSCGQLYEILINRAKQALIENTYENELINQIARYCYETTGDAREAIHLLKTTVELAEKDNTGKITKEHFELAKEVTEKERLQMELKDQSLHIKLTFYALCIYFITKNTCPPFEHTYPIYKELATQIKKDISKQRMVRRYLKKLVEIQLIDEFMERGKLFYKPLVEAKTVKLFLDDFYLQHSLQADTLSGFIDDTA